MISLLAGLIVFVGVTLGLAWPLVERLSLEPAEKLTATAALSLVGVFLYAWFVYIAMLPLAALYFLPVAAAAGLISGRRSFALLLRDPDTASILTGQAIITL